MVVLGSNPDFDNIGFVRVRTTIEKLVSGGDRIGAI